MAEATIAEAAMAPPFVSIADLSLVYGRHPETPVQALSDIDVADRQRQLRFADWPLRLWQEHAAAHPRRPAVPDQGQRHD